jgi:cytochrome c556
VLRLPEYAKHTAAFQRSVRAVIAAAGERDQRTALAAYNGLVASCVECHSYVARARIARSQ